VASPKAVGGGKKAGIRLHRMLKKRSSQSPSRSKKTPSRSLGLGEEKRKETLGMLRMEKEKCGRLELTEEDSLMFFT